MLNITGTPTPVKVVGQLDDVVENQQQAQAVAAAMEAPAPAPVVKDPKADEQA